MDNSLNYYIFILLIVTVDITWAQLSTTECGVKKNCIYYPPACKLTKDCTKIVSYEPKEDGWTTIELFYNGTNPDTNFAAIGFSNDTTMGNDAVTHCGFNDDGNVGVFLSYNSDKNNEPIEFNNQYGLSEYVELLRASRDSSHIYCAFRQKISPDEDGIKANIPNLDKNYTLLLAYGKTPDYRKVDIHSLDTSSNNFPTVIATTTNVADLAVLPQEVGKDQLQRSKPGRIYVLLHGVLMIVSWLWLIATAIISAKYLRDHFPQTTPMGLKIWFHIHRMLNSFAILVIIIAVILIFLGKEWRWTGPAVGRTYEQNTSPGAIHSIIGAIAIGLALTQPVGALFRCAPDARFRPVFNWIHRFDGLLAFILAFVVLIIAVAYFHVWSSRLAAILLISAYALLFIILIIFAHLISNMGNRHISTITYEPNGSSRGDRINVITKGKDYQKTKNMLLMLISSFFILSTLITIAMILIILF